MIMRLSKALIDMEMADYSAALDPAYTTLEFENMQVLAMGNGKSPLSSPLCCGMSWGLQDEKSMGQQPKCHQEGLGHSMGVSRGSQQLMPGVSASLGRNRGGGAMLCSAQAGWCPADRAPREWASTRS